MAYYENTQREISEPNLGQGRKVLVVDDNHASRVVARAIFERENYSVRLAENGLESVDIAQSEAFDIILMDVQMPDISGIEAATRIKSGGGVNASTPIVALTAYADKIIIEDAQAAGVSEVLTKPLRIGQLRSAWQRALNVSEPVKPRKPAKILSLSSTEPSSKIVLPLLDEVVLSPLFTAASPEALDTLYQRFSKSAELFISAINKDVKLIQQGKIDVLDNMRRTAHALKGAASSVGFARLSAQAARLQNASPDNLVQTASQLGPIFVHSSLAFNDYKALNSAPLAAPHCETNARIK